MPSETKAERHWRTRQDGFAEVWPGIRERLRTLPALEAKTIFAALQRQYPDRFADGQLRTLQRRIKQWRAVRARARSVFRPGASGRRAMRVRLHPPDELGMTIGGQPFPHMLYHFVLTYSNWETGTICFSESFESLSDGLQNALWELGGVPQLHRTDRLTAAVNNLTEQAEFQQRYQALLRHYALEGRKSRPASRTKTATWSSAIIGFNGRWIRPDVAWQPRLRGRGRVRGFLGELFEQLNSGRDVRAGGRNGSCCGRCRRAGWDSASACGCGWTRGSMIRVERNVYSVPSRLIGEMGRGPDVRRARRGLVRRTEGGAIAATAWPRQTSASTTGTSSTGWCASRGPSPTTVTVRTCSPAAASGMAYDLLERADPGRATRRYLEILDLAAKEGEAGWRMLCGVCWPASRAQRTHRGQEAFAEFSSVATVRRRSST